MSDKKHSKPRITITSEQKLEYAKLMVDEGYTNCNGLIDQYWHLNPVFENSFSSLVDRCCINLRYFYRSMW